MTQILGAEIAREEEVFIGFRHAILPQSLV